MSNSQLDVLVVAVLIVHLLVLAIASAKRRFRSAVLWLNAADAAVVLVWLAINRQWAHPPLDWPVVGLGVFDLAALTASVLAIRRVRGALVAAWITFSGHVVISALAAVFALTFKFTRLF